MRVLSSIVFAAALVSESAGLVFAAPTPFLQPQPVVAHPMGLPLSDMSLGQHPQAAAGGTLFSFCDGPKGTGYYPEGGLIDHLLPDAVIREKRLPSAAS